MHYRNLGRTGLKVSALCLGTMTMGKQVDEATSLAIIARAVDLGVTFLDTADMYVNGVTEKILAKNGIFKSCIAMERCAGRLRCNIFR